MEGPLGGGCCWLVATMRSRLGKGGKSVMSGCFLMTSFRSIFVGNGTVVAPGGTSIICPPRAF